MNSKSWALHSLPYGLILSGCILGILEFSNPPMAYSQNRTCNIGSLPAHPGNYKIRGTISLKKELFREALDCFEIALQDERGRKDPELWNNHGLALAGLKRFDEAIASYDRALQIKPGGKFVDRSQPLVQEEDYYLWWFNRGTALLDLKRYQEAIADLDRSLKIKSDYGFVWFFRGLALFRLERYEEALISYRRSVLLSPNSSYIIKAKHFFSVQDYVVYYGEAEAKTRLGRYKDAIRAFDRGKRIRLGNPEIKLFQSNIDEITYENYIEGVYSLERGNYSQSLNTFNQIIATNPNYANAWYAKADTLFALKRYDEAIQAFDRVTSIEPDDYAGWYKKGNVLRESKRYEEALQSYQKAISLSGGFAEVWHNQGLIFYTQGKYADAINAYNRSLKANTLWGGVERINTEYGLAASLYGAGRYKESSFTVEKVLKEKPNHKQGLELRKLLKSVL